MPPAHTQMTILLVDAIILSFEICSFCNNIALNCKNIAISYMRRKTKKHLQTDSLQIV